MNWNLETEHFVIRLPLADQDGDALFGLLKNPQAGAHLPRLPMFVSVQSLDELRRATMRFQAREAATWLVLRRSDNVDDLAAFQARITLQNINWMLSSARLQWELADDVKREELAEMISAVESFCFDELQLHRLELRMVPEAAEQRANAEALGYQYEGCLPAQMEFDERWIDQVLYSRLATDRV